VPPPRPFAPARIGRINGGADAEIAGISPRTLRHAAATWLMQKGADPWQAAGYLGMSLEVLLNTYGHHHPDYLSDAVEKIAMRTPGHERKAHVSGAVSGAVIPLRRDNP
jgi:integrase